MRDTDEAPRLNLRQVRTWLERPLWNAVGKRADPQSDCGKRRAQKLGTVLRQRSRHRRCVRRWHACQRKYSRKFVRLTDPLLSVMGNGKSKESAADISSRRIRSWTGFGTVTAYASTSYEKILKQTYTVKREFVWMPSGIRSMHRAVCKHGLLRKSAVEKRYGVCHVWWLARYSKV